MSDPPHRIRLRDSRGDATATWCAVPAGGPEGLSRAPAASVGATVDAVYFSVGSADVTIVADAPDDTAAAAITAIGMTVVAARVTESVEIIPVPTPEELDAATKMSPSYRAPGA